MVHLVDWTRVIFVAKLVCFFLIGAGIYATPIGAQEVDQLRGNALPAWTLVGEQSDSAGETINGIGDINNDGFADIAVALFSEYLIFLGSEEGLSSEPDLDNSIIGPSGSFYPQSIANAGDVNGDGYTDVILGAPFQDSEENESVGEVRLVYGGKEGFARSLSWQVYGEETDSQFGNMVDSAGDVNGDGYDDIVVSAPGTFDGSVGGSVHVYHGGPDGLDTTPSFRAVGEEGSSRFGNSVSAAGDMNGDGFDDLVVSAGDAERIYYYLGTEGGLASTPSAELQGEEYDFIFGQGIDQLGDVNGDGYDDIVVDAVNIDDTVKAYVYLGSDTGPSETPDQRIVLQNPDRGDVVVQGVGDLNNDGYMDMGIGLAVPGYTESGSGAVFVYFGNQDGVAAEASVVINGDELGDEFGGAVARAGDVNGDGYADLLVGAPNSSEGGNYAGKVYLYYGSGDGLLPATASASAFKQWHPSREQVIQSQIPGEAFGWQTAIVPDVNGDSYDELAIASFGNADTGMPGRLLIYYGSVDGVSEHPDWEVGPEEWPALVNARGEQLTDAGAFAVAGIGDSNGDGYNDVAVTVASAVDEASLLLIYSGSENGLSAEPGWSIEPVEPSVEIIGVRLTALGDVNGDGFMDLGVISVPVSEDDATRFSIYHGSAQGLAEKANLSRTLPLSDPFMLEIAPLGDANGDGYADVVVGAPGSLASDVAQISVLFGSDEGIDVVPVWEENARNDNTLLGMRVAGTGDIDGDGFPDFATTLTDESASTQEILIYINGDELTKQKIAHPEPSSIGFALGGIGDLNGDGYNDLITAGISNDGLTWYAFGGSDEGIMAQPFFTRELSGQEPVQLIFQTFAAGDLNGDGYADFAYSNLDLSQLQSSEPTGSEVVVIYGNHDSSENTAPPLLDPTALKAPLTAREDSRSLLVAKGLWELGTELLAAGDYDEAVLKFEQAIEADSSYAPAYNGRGRAHLGREDFENALTDFDRAIQLDVTLWPPYFNRGVIHFQQEDYQQAFKDLTMAIGLEPTMSASYYWRGYTYIALGKMDAAIQDLEIYLTLEPEGEYRQEVEEVLEQLE